MFEAVLIRESCHLTNPLHKLQPRNLQIKSATRGLYGSTGNSLAGQYFNKPCKSSLELFNLELELLPNAKEEPENIQFGLIPLKRWTRKSTVGSGDALPAVRVAPPRHAVVIGRGRSQQTPVPRDVGGTRPQTRELPAAGTAGPRGAAADGGSSPERS